MTSKYGSGMGVLWDGYSGVHSADLVPELMAFGGAKQERLNKEIGEVRARIYRSHLNGTVFPRPAPASPLPWLGIPMVQRWP